MTPLPVSAAPVTLILTTAGLTFKATAIVADCSSTGAGATDAAIDAWATAGAALGAGRSSAPAALSAMTVPPAARIAERSEAAISGPAPPPLRRRFAGAAGAAAPGAARGPGAG